MIWEILNLSRPTTESFTQELTMMLTTSSEHRRTCLHQSNKSLSKTKKVSNRLKSKASKWLKKNRLKSDDDRIDV